MYNFYVLLLLIFFNVTSLVGQDFFYNSQHFGLQSSLLGGAVTAGNNDLGMAYYNPAALKHVTPQLDVSLFQPRIQRFGFGNLLGKRSRAYNLELGFSPNMTAVRIELFKKR